MIGHRLAFAANSISRFRHALNQYIPVTPDVISVWSATRSIDSDWRMPAIFRVQVDDDRAEQGQPTHGGQFEVECYLGCLSKSAKEEAREPDPGGFGMSYLKDNQRDSCSGKNG